MHTSYKVRPTRIYSITFQERGRRRVATTGMEFEKSNDIVVAIFEASGPVYFVCTLSRGIGSGTPYFIGRDEVISVNEFDLE